MNVHLSSTEQPAFPISLTGLTERALKVCADLSDCAATSDADAKLSDLTLDLLKQSGLSRAPLPVEHGGNGLLAPSRSDELCFILQLFGAADLSMARIFEGHINAVALVYRYGTRCMTETFSRQIGDGALSGVWGADDAKGLIASPIPGGWRLDGTKIFASGAGLLTRPVITATTDEGQALFLLELGPGERSDVSGWTAQGMRASATGTVDLTGMELRHDQLIGHPGDFMRQPHFSGGAWRFCAVHLGATERLLDLFRQHLLSRKREGDPYQLARIASCVAAVWSARFWVEKTARSLADDRADPQAIVALANMTRLVTERSALDVMEAVHRGVGLAGFLRPSPIERISRDLATYLRQPVPDAAMADAARWVLGTDLATRDLWTSHES